jgi:hypothetical protein
MVERVPPLPKTMVVLIAELWLNRAVLKQKAIELLGGTVATAAKEIGVTHQAIAKWPDELPPRIADRVLAAVARKHLPRVLLGLGDDTRGVLAAGG